MKQRLTVEGRATNGEAKTAQAVSENRGRGKSEVQRGVVLPSLAFSASPFLASPAAPRSGEDRGQLSECPRCSAGPSQKSGDALRTPAPLPLCDQHDETR